MTTRPTILALSITGIVALLGWVRPARTGPVLSQLGVQQAIPLRCDAALGRTVIDAAHTPGDADSLFLITNPGSYYLAGNIEGVAGKHGIEVLAGGPVTIDLNGFSVIGVPGSLDGISSSASTRIVNGSVVQWGGRGVFVNQGNLDRLRVAWNGAEGIRALWGSVITGCTLEANGGDGISVGDTSRIEGCVSKVNQGRGIRLDGACILAGCVIYNNAAGGILAGLATIRDNKLFSNQGNSIELSGFGVVRGNNISLGTTGIFTDGDRSRIEDNTILGCVTGIDVDGVDNLIFGNALQGNTAAFEIVAGNTFGPIVDVGGAGDVSGTPAAGHPLANLIY